MTNLNEPLVLTAERRNTFGKNTAKLRRTGQLPAIVYGRGKTPQPLVVDARRFEKIYHQAGESSLIDLQINDAPSIKVLIQDVQHHPVTDRLLHADFHEVTMTEKLQTDITLRFDGVAPAVHELGGVLVTNLEQVRVECLPSDLVHEIVVDISVFKTFDDLIRLQDLTPPAGIVFLDKPETVVAVVTPPRTEEELKALESEVVEEVEKVEAIKKKPEEAEAEAEAEGSDATPVAPEKTKDKKDS